MEPGGLNTLGSLVTQTAGAETAGSVDTVFGDVAGDNGWQSRRQAQR
jgi:hypothetical protein